MVRRVHSLQRLSRELVAGTAAALVLIGALVLTYGVGVIGAICGIAVAFGIVAALGRGLSHAGQPRLTPADRVTLARAVLTVGVTALVTESFVAAVPTIPLVALATVALALDFVDGRVARRTGTAHELGATFDMEVDALLILVLSVFVAADLGWWVLAIGAAHYLLLAARRLWSWLRAPLPPRYWCKVVAALQGIVLTLAASEVLPHEAATLMVAIAGGLLVESFGREIWQLWRQQARVVRHPEEVARASHAGRIAVGTHR